MVYFDLLLLVILIVQAIFNMLRKNVPRKLVSRIDAKDVRKYNRLNAVCYLCFAVCLGIVLGLGTPTQEVRSSGTYLFAFLVALAGILCRLMNDALHLNGKADEE